jgi:MarR family transcriptional regulator for hemolysin
MSGNPKGRVGARSNHRRGPQAARADDRDLLSEQIDRIAGDNDTDERFLRNFRAHFPEETDDYDYFRMTRSLVTAARRWRKLANDRIKPLGQTMARWETLFLVAYNEHDVTQSELARLISVEGPTMVRMLDVLSRDGLIERRQSESDARVTTNRITPKGTAAIAEIMKVTNRLRAQVLEDIDRDDLATTLKVMNQILHKLDALRVVR